MMFSPWILVACVFAAATVVGLTVGSPPAPGELTPEQWRKRVAQYFPGWQPKRCILMTAAPRPVSSITHEGLSSRAREGQRYVESSSSHRNTTL